MFDFAKLLAQASVLAGNVCLCRVPSIYITLTSIGCPIYLSVTRRTYYRAAAGESLLDVMVELPWSKMCLNVALSLLLLLYIFGMLSMIGANLVTLEHAIFSRQDELASSTFYRATLLMDIVVATFIYFRTFGSVFIPAYYYEGITGSTTGR